MACCPAVSAKKEAFSCVPMVVWSASPVDPLVSTCGVERRAEFSALGSGAAVSWPWVSAWGSLEPSRRGGENAQKARKNGEEMGEIWSKTCEHRQGQEGSPGIESRSRKTSRLRRTARGSQHLGCEPRGSAIHQPHGTSTSPRVTPEHPHLSARDPHAVDEKIKVRRDLVLLRPSTDQLSPGRVRTWPCCTCCNGGRCSLTL